MVKVLHENEERVVLKVGMNVIALVDDVSIILKYKEGNKQITKKFAYTDMVALNDAINFINREKNAEFLRLQQLERNMTNNIKRRLSKIKIAYSDVDCVCNQKNGD
jgi:hypothetical protein